MGRRRMIAPLAVVLILGNVSSFSPFGSVSLPDPFRVAGVSRTADDDLILAVISADTALGPSSLQVVPSPIMPALPPPAEGQAPGARLTLSTRGPPIR
ncbi:MAG: hypothetical protein HY002_13090 [Candidatus Rokubacteria bacterium]|nr:hypothetical protein [Candidatus Rokubacteria bacterium]